MPRFSIFFAFECPKFSDMHVCAHIFAQILVRPMFSLSQRICRALTPLFENGAGAYGIGNISGVLTKIVKFDGYICSFLGPSLYYVSPNKYNAV